MIIHLIRHGQPISRDSLLRMNLGYPVEDPPLTVLGREQSRLLGKKLLVLKVGGQILSSPYCRTIETAQVLAEVTNNCVIPELSLQEHVFQSGKPTFDGLSLERIIRRCPLIRKGARLPYPWFVEGPETEEDLHRRVTPLIENLVKSHPENLVLVSHEDTINACIEVLLGKEMVTRIFRPQSTYNCSFTSINVGPKGNTTLIRTRDVSHLPPEFITSNDIFHNQKDGSVHMG